ncbi:hypothetical protein MPSEU_001101300 [Mayamaea pseudoterrestris]|nr:hypothetical protein MPSEU_001101300 [Mayamaea pseudoterrestris]
MKRGMDREEIPMRLQGHGIVIYTITDGDGVNYPRKGDTCLLMYQILTEDGTLVDETPKPLKIEVGANHLILGLELAVPKLSLGQIAEVVVPPLYGYGSVGCPPNILANATYIYKVQVVDVTRKK